LKELANLIRISPHKLREECKKSTEEMIRHVLSINEEDGLLQTGLLSSAKYMTGNDELRITVSKYLLPYLVKMKEKPEIVYPLGGPLKFSNIYSYYFLDLMMMDSDKKEIYYETEELRKLLDVPHDFYRSDDGLTETKNFNTRIINACIKDVNSYTPINISFEPKKEMRKTVGYIFSVEKKSRDSENILAEKEMGLFDIEELIPTPDEIRRILSEQYKITNNVVDRLMRNYYHGRIWCNIKYAERAKNVKNMAPYIIKAVESDWDQNDREIRRLKKTDARKAKDLKDKIRNDIAEIEAENEKSPEDTRIEVAKMMKEYMVKQNW
jgi:plasmid replication initiation protein